LVSFLRPRQKRKTETEAKSHFNSAYNKKQKKRPSTLKQTQLSRNLYNPSPCAIADGLIKDKKTRANLIRPFQGKIAV